MTSSLGLTLINFISKCCSCGLITVALASLLLVSSCSQYQVKPSKTEDNSASVKANQLFDAIFDAEVALSPEHQSYLGIKDNNHLWDDRSESFALKIHELNLQHLAQLNAIDSQALDEQTNLSLKLYIEKMSNRITDFQWRHHNYPVNQMFGVHSSLPALLINTHRISNFDDARDYISRLNKIPKVIDQLIDGLETRKQKQIIAPKFVFPLVIKDCKNLLKGQPFSGLEDSTLLADFKNKTDKLPLSPKEIYSLQVEASDALLNRVGPAYEKLIAYLQSLETLADKRAGVWKLPKGREFYNTALERTTTTSLSAEQIHQIGLEEVSRIHSEMRSIMKIVGFKGELQDFFQFMRTDQQFYYPNNDKGRADYLAKNIELIDAMRSQLDKLFLSKPKADLEVVRVEPFREKSAGKAFYQRPAPDGSRPGRYYANLYNMGQMPSYQMEALAYHEAIPGHHMQISIAQELKGLPKFRKYGHYTAYIEGWGLYSEFIPKEIGYYQNPYSDFGRLAMELWRACRLVVDTGLHAKKWTREQAINYLVENTPNPKEDSVRAIERYIVMPSQATSYKIGMIRILQLRAKAKKELGSDFDIRAFHDVLLRNGALPLNILEDIVNNWIANQQTP